jgi:hypothetical protein
MRRVAGIMTMVAAVLLIPSVTCLAQQPNVHYYQEGATPPGAIGSQQLQRGGPLPGYYQPVEIKSPAGASISMAVNGQFEEPRPSLRKAGMLIGSVYRLRVTNIPLAEGQEVYPTIEVIDRLFTPVGQEHRFSIPVELSLEELRLALAGKFVTRIIYVEDPRSALPIGDNPQQQTWFEAPVGQDPMAIADVLGRPVAILRMGGRLPDANAAPDPQFFFGCPPFTDYPSEPAPAEEMPLPVSHAKAKPKAAGKTAAKAGMKAEKKPVEIPVSKLPTSKSAVVKTSFDVGAVNARVSATPNESENLKASFAFEKKPSQPKSEPESKVKILPPPPTLEKSPAMSASSDKEGPRS